MGVASPVFGMADAGVVMVDVLSFSFPSSSRGSAKRDRGDLKLDDCDTELEIASSLRNDGRSGFVMTMSGLS